MRANGELDITPDMEAEIAIRARQLSIDPARLRYWVQFGPCAPTPPDPPSRWKVIWWIIQARTKDTA